MSKVRVGIRRENKNVWEKRVPLTPNDVKEVMGGDDIEFFVQPSPIRVFKDGEYKKVGAGVNENLSPCDVVFAVKEIPVQFIEKGKTYVFFSHVIKGQHHNMPMLKKIIDQKSTLIDYEKVVDEKGKRIIFFGEYAGLAGMIDTLWALGRRLEHEGIKAPFSRIKQGKEYSSLREAQSDLAKVASEIKSKGLPDELTPLVFGIAGYGNVSRGVQEILDLLPVEELSPEELPSLCHREESRFAGRRGDLPNKGDGGGLLRFARNDRIYKAVFKEEHMVETVLKGQAFELKDYFDHPEKYKGKFEGYVKHLTVFMNCIYWDNRYPRLITKKLLKELYLGGAKPKLKVIGDISCDIEGAVECTLHCTNPGTPVFVYDVSSDKAVDGFKGNGPVVLAIDNLPCELPRESSEYFSGVLKRYVAAIADAHYSRSFDELDLPREIKDAVIVYRGELTPNYKYLEKFMEGL